jgi:histidyl-tRNA synthetase
VGSDPLRPPRGTRDFYPEDLRRRAWLFDRFRAVSRSFAFEEVDAPLVEHAELFVRKAGEEIVEQLYHFELHDRHLALRGEITPSIARMVIARAGGLRLPVRWFCIGQNWRYERMTRGRTREHYQWNVEIVGESGVGAEAELMAALCSLWDSLGLARDDARLRVNSRALLEETLRQGVLRDRPEAFTPLCVLVDKLGKIGADAVMDQLSDPEGLVALPREDARWVVDALAARSLDDAAAAAPADSPAMAELRRLFELLEGYGIADRVEFDASVVRGLAYYTGIVFEGFDAGGRLRSICGGGRYDRLIETLGGPSLPAVGFGMGDVVVGELLSERGLLPETPRDVDDVVVALGEEQRAEAIRVATRLRADGRAVELMLGTARLKRALGHADRIGARRVVLVGPDEVARGVARIRDLTSGQERDEKIA